jgi:hypothetical protein
VRRGAVLAAVAVGAGRLAVALTASVFGGAPLPGADGLLRIAAIALVSAPLGPPALAGARRRPAPAQGGGRP